VHPINEKREEVGLFYTLFEDLRKDEKKSFLTISVCPFPLSMSYMND